VRNQFRRQAPVADAAHLIAVPAVVADHLRPLVRDVLGDGGQEVGGGEDFEVAVDLGIEARAIDDDVGGPFQRHLLNREGIAQDVLGQGFEVGLGLGRHLLAGVDVEAAVFPGVEDLDPFGRKESLLDQEVDDLAAEEFFQRLDRGVGQGMEGVAGWRLEAGGWCGGLGRLAEKEPVGYQSVDVGVEI